MSHENMITLNRLPSKTWNRLNVNESSINIENTDLTGNCKCVLNKTARDTACHGNEDGCADLSGIDTGMGNEMTAFMKSADTVYIRTAPDSLYEEPAILEYHYEADKSYANRMEIKAEHDSSIEVIITSESSGKGKGGTAALQVLVQADTGADVRIYAVQMLSEGVRSLTDFGIREEADASVKIVRLELGAGEIYTGVFSKLRGDRSRFDADTAYHAHANQHIDMNYVARHEGNKTVSRMDVNGVLRDEAKKIFRGTIDFRRGCAGSKGDEKEDVLLLGDKVVNHTVPLILCQEEDVEGNHGASIGELDDAVLFYMGSRGISREDAENMIAEARIRAVAELVPSEEIREKVYGYIKKIRG